MTQPEDESLRLLCEKHNFENGDNVVVFERYKPDICHKGKIYSIKNLPMNKYIKQYKNIFVDYFYISFPIEIYDKLLQRGIEVIYKHKPVILGNIELDENGKIQKIYSQECNPGCTIENQIYLQDINAILIWRRAYEIKKN